LAQQIATYWREGVAMQGNATRPGAAEPCVDQEGGQFGAKCATQAADKNQQKTAGERRGQQSKPPSHSEPLLERACPLAGVEQ